MEGNLNARTLRVVTRAVRGGGRPGGLRSTEGGIGESRTEGGAAGAMREIRVMVIEGDAAETGEALLLVPARGVGIMGIVTQEGTILLRAQGRSLKSDHTIARRGIDRMVARDRTHGRVDEGCAGFLVRGNARTCCPRL